MHNVKNKKHLLYGFNAITEELDLTDQKLRIDKQKLIKKKNEKKKKEKKRKRNLVVVVAVVMKMMKTVMYRRYHTWTIHQTHKNVGGCTRMKCVYFCREIHFF